MEGARVSGLIDWSRRKKSDDAAVEDLQDIEIEVAFDHALATYAMIKERGGDWRIRGDHALSEEEIDIEYYYRQRNADKAQAIIARQEFLDTITLKEEVLDRLRSRGGSIIQTVHQNATRRVHAEKTEEVTKLETLLLKNPDTYFALKRQELLETKKIFDESGTIVETPYVQRRIARVRDILSNGRPVFIHGELGAGKTELAKHICRRYLAREHLARWEASNPRPQEPRRPKNADERSLRAWRDDQNAWRDTRASWKQAQQHEAEPLLIAGRKDIETESITARRGIRRKETIPPAQQADTITKEWALLEPALNDLDQETRERMRHIHQQAWLEAFKSPTEIVGLLGPLLQAMKEGRPVIIDEMNAIPHHVLIVMNDFLTRKVGDTIPAFLPGLEPFRVQEGFSVLATGNYKPEDGKMYVGRQQIDAAFLSRFGIVSYDYLPMEREAEAEGLSPEEQRAYREKNELYHMLVTRLLDSDLTLRISEDGLLHIERLARVARMIQDIFSGMSDEKVRIDADVEVDPKRVLSENVLSIRHLMPILDAWRNDGFSRDLDYYLFREYVERPMTSRPKEALFLYTVLNVQGDFFQESKGWPNKNDPKKVASYPIEEKFRERVSGAIYSAAPAMLEDSQWKTYSTRDIITALYGPLPERTSISEKIVRRWHGRTDASGETADLSELEREREIDEMVALLTKLKNDGFDIFRKP